MQNKLIALATIALLSATAVYMNQGETQMLPLEAEFAQWKLVHSKSYSGAEHTHRFQIFAQNYLLVQSHNARYAAGLETFAVGMNLFADLTNEEFVAKYLTLTPKRMSGIRAPFKGIQLPETVDWTSELGLKVRNQGSCGSCWAFSALGAVEAFFAQQGQTGLDLSEQELVDCCRGGSYESEGCNGGWMSEALDYVHNTGIALESDYPYVGADQQCKRDTSKTRHQTGGYVDVTPNNRDAFHEAIATRPVSVAINAGGIWFQLYTKGVFTKTCKGGIDDLNHGVVAVGYDLTAATPFQKIKNSWGSGWGEDGYIRFGLTDSSEGKCGVQQLPNYPI